METVLKAVIVVYNLWVIPILLGLLLNKYNKLQINGSNFAFIVLRGWLFMLFLFYIEAVPLILNRRALYELSVMWEITLFTITAISVMILRQDIKYIIIVIRDLMWRSKRIVIICSCLVIGCIFFIRPMAEDDTVELAMTAYSTNTMYQYQPYTLELYELLPEDQIWSPLEMYYATLAYMAGAHPAIIVRIMIPLGFLPIAMLTYWLWGTTLFWKNHKTKLTFLAVCGIIYVFAISSTQMSLMKLLQNSWRGDVILMNIIIPLVLHACYRMLVETKESNFMEIISWVIVIGTVGQLMHSTGMLLTILIAFVCIIIMGFRRYTAYARNA